MTTIVGYQRVSTSDQTTVRQDPSMAECSRVFTDISSATKLSDADSQRSAMLDYVRSGDTVRVHSLDRLARSLSDLIDVLNALVDKGVAVEFISERLTFAPRKNDPMARLQLHMLGAVAEFERSLIRQRQAEGIEVAKKAGKYTGRRPSIDRKTIMRLAGHGETATDIAKMTGVSRASVYRILKDARLTHIHSKKGFR